MPTVDIRASNSGGGASVGASSMADLWTKTSGGTDTSGTDLPVKLSTTYYEAYELLCAFVTDSTNIPSGATIDSATLSLSRIGWGGGCSAGDIEAHVYDWSGGGFTGADFLGSAELASLHSSAFVAASPSVTNSSGIVTVTFTSESGLTDAINTGGSTYIAFSPSNLRTQTSVAQSLQLYTQFHATAAYRPTLSVTYSEPAAPTVTTTAITSITASTASGGGTITDQGDSAVTDYGVCWNTTGTPTIADFHTHDKP